MGGEKPQAKPTDPESKNAMQKALQGWWNTHPLLMMLLMAFGGGILFLGAMFGLCYTCDLPNDFLKLPWQTLTLLVAAPSLILLWYWRVIHKKADLSLAEDRKRTESFARTVELLGHDSPDVKMGAIQVLAQLAEEYPEHYHWMVVEMLAAFIRQHAEEDAMHEAVQLAISKIGGRKIENIQEYEINPFTERYKIIPLSRTIFEKVGFSGANYSNVDFSKSTFRMVDFRSATLSSVCFYGTTFYQSITDYEKINIREEYLCSFKDAEILDTDFRGADLRGAELLKANIHKDTVTYRDQRPGVTLDSIPFRGTTFHENEVEELKKRMTLVPW